MPPQSSIRYREAANGCLTILRRQIKTPTRN
jgi:hypothetical protein